MFSLFRQHVGVWLCPSSSCHLIGSTRTLLEQEFPWRAATTPQRCPGGVGEAEHSDAETTSLRDAFNSALPEPKLETCNQSCS